MSDPADKLARDLFCEVVGLPSADQARYLAEHPASASVLAQVRALLDGFEAEGGMGEPVRAGGGGGGGELKPDATEATTEAESREPSGSEVAWSDLSEVAIRHYPRRRELGRGGMGIVYEVWDPAVNRPLAMKVMKARTASGTTGTLSRLEARFLKEARITGQLDHPGVVPVHEIGSDEDGNVFFTMQVVAGKSLQEILTLPSQQRAEEGWTTTRLLSILLNVCETLAYAHSKGIIHRDLKPHNIMVGQFGETYVMDWGLAKHIDAPESAVEESTIDTAELTLEGAVMGTPMFMAPEQAAGENHDLQFECDVYQVGAILYNVVGGSAPYADSGSRSSREVIVAVLSDAPTPLEKLAPQVPPELVAICEMAMQRDPSRRYRAMASMGEDLRAYLEQRVVTAYQSGALAELKKWIARNRGFATALGVATMIAIVAFTAVSWLQSKRNSDLRKHADELTIEKSKTDLALAMEQEANRHVRSLILAEASAHILEEDPATALLLALEAAKLESSAAVNTAILRAMDASREIKTLVGIGKQAPKVTAFSPDGSRIVTGTAQHRVVIAEVATGRRLALGIGHTGLLREISFSPDGTRVVSASWDGTVALWDAANGQLRGALPTEPGEAGVASFSPDGQMIVVGAANGLRRWDPRSGGVTDLPLDPATEVLRAAFSPDGSRLIAGCIDGTARLLDPEAGRQLAVLAGHDGGVDRVMYSPDGSSLLTVVSQPVPGSDGTTGKLCHLWTLDGESLLEFRTGKARITSAVFSNGGSRVVTASDDKQVRIWSAQSGALIHDLPLESTQLHLDVDSSGTLIAMAGEDGNARVWDSAREVMALNLRGHDQEIRTVRFDSAGNRLLTGSEDGTIRIWRIDSTGPFDFLANAEPVAFALFQPDSDRVLTVSRDQPKVALWDISDGVRVFELELEAMVQSAFFSSDGARLITRDIEGEVRLWSATEGASLGRIPIGNPAGNLRLSDDDRFLLMTVPGQGAERWLLEEQRLDHRIASPALFMEFSGNGRRLIEKSPAGIRLWDVDLERPIAEPLDGRDGNAAFSPAGTLLTWPHKTVGARGEIVSYGLKLWDAESGAFLTTIPGHEKAVYGPAFEPGGNLLVTPSLDGLAKLWDTRSGTLLTTLTGHRGPVNAAWINRGGGRIVTRCFDDRSTRLWDGASGASLGVIGGDERRMSDVTFSPSGRYLITAIADESEALLWAAGECELIASLPGHQGPVTMAAFSPDEKWVLTLSREGGVRLWPVDIVGVASQLVPRELMPNELDLYNIGTAADRAAIKSRRSLNQHCETLRLLQNAVAGEESLARLRDAYLEVLRAIAEVPPSADPVTARETITDLLTSLATLGSEDPVAHLETARILADRGEGSRARTTLERAREFPELGADLDQAIETLHKQLSPVAP